MLNVDVHESLIIIGPLQVSKHGNCFLCITFIISDSFTFLQGGICTLYIPDEDKVVSVASEHLEPQIPQKGDRVRLHFFVCLM